MVAKNLSKIISGNDTANVERWSIPSVEAGGASYGGNSMLTAGKIEEIQRQAQQEGYENGYREGLAKAEVDIRQHVERLTQIFQILQAPLNQLDDTVEEELVSLAMVIARQIIRRELKTDPTHVVAVVREAVASLPMASRTVRIRLHPEDAELVRKALSVSESEQGWYIVDDPVMTRGGCQVLTETSQVDATVEKRLTAIASQLMGGERDGE